jgi:hypothetical protein
LDSVEGIKVGKAIADKLKEALPERL